MKNDCIRLALVILLLASASARAGFIDFDSHAFTGSTGGPPPVDFFPPEAAIVTDDYASQGIVFGYAGFSTGSVVVRPSPGNAVSEPAIACGLDAIGVLTRTCSADQYFQFEADGLAAFTDSLSFFIGDAGNDFDEWIVHVYSVAGIELEARNVSGIANNLVTFDHAGMHRVHIEWTAGHPQGYGLDNISFTAPTPVPVPGTMLIVLLGLLMIPRTTA